MTRRVVCAIAALLLLPPAADGYWTFPPPSPPEEYGNLLINRTSEWNNVRPATFSHWMHRRKHTCRVCHFELEFNMKVNTTEITEEANRSGRFCGACHDGKNLFGHVEPHCERCHNGNPGHGNERFTELRHFPAAGFGNGIDWDAALEGRWTNPIRFLSIPPLSNESGNREILLESEWAGTPPAVFPMGKHVMWLDCNDCHPQIFNIKKKSTKHFNMVRSLDGEFCGLCHMTVAFPMTDCRRCHPSMRKTPEYERPVSR